VQAIVLSGVVKRLERERMLAEKQAWDTAYLAGISYHNPKKFPEFDRFRSRPVGVARERPKMDWKKMKSIIVAHVAASGGEVISNE
jgi:hypothetical protein